MNKSFSNLYLVPLTVLVLASFAVAPADAAGGRAGGGGGGGGGARAGGSSGGGAKPSAQPNNSKADSRSNDVRSTSVNNTNVNVNKDVNVNVNVDQGGGIGGWDHPVAGAIVIGGAIAVTAAALGSTVAAVPVGCVPVNYSGMVYQQCGSTWYAPQGSQFVVVNPPY